MMIRFYLKLTFIVTLIFIIANETMQLLGAAQPPKAEMIGFSVGCADQPQPCWYGIVPGVTLIEEAERKLLEAGYAADVGKTQLYVRASDGCAIEMSRDATSVRRLTLDLSCSPVQSGNIMAQFGTPDGIGAWRLFFGAGRVQAVIANQLDGVAQNRCMDFSPHGKTIALILQNPRGVVSDSEPILWRGALAYLFYVQRYDAWTCQLLMDAPF